MGSTIYAARQDGNARFSTLQVQLTENALITRAVVVDSNGKFYYSNSGGGGSGTVTRVSVVSANGLAGTVATDTTTPAITLSTTITGILKGNGTAISAATPGADYITITAGTASWALNALTASYFIGSVTSASYAGTASVLLGSVQSASYASTASWALNFITSSVTSASYAATASSADSFNVRTSATASNLLVTGTITAQTLVVQTITSSVEYSSGSNIFGSKLTDTQQFTGSVSITGSLSVVGAVSASSFTGSIFGTASWARNSLTASYFVTSSVTSASYAATASYFVTSSVTSASYAATASYFITSSVTSASYAETASNINGGATNYIPLFTNVTNLSSSVLYQSASNLGVYTTVPSGALDISFGGASNKSTILLGADNGLTTRTQNTQKFGTIAIAPYNNASSSTAIIQANTSNNTSSIYIGGGSNNLNTVTDIAFYTAVNVGTLIGTERFRLSGGPINVAYTAAQFSGSFNKTGSATINANLLISGSVIISGSIYPSPSGSGQGLTVGTASAANHTLGGPKNAWYRLYVAKQSIIFVDDVTEDLNYSLGVDTGGSLSYNGFPIINGSGSISASYPIKSIGTSLYSTKPGSGISGSTTASIYFGNNTGNYAITADYSNFIGDQAGVAAYSSSYSNFLGANAGFSASISYFSNFLGYLAGYQAQYANSSNFLGNQAGSQATSASNSNFLGSNAGISATNANNSNFFGQQAGRQANSASYSNLFGYKVGNNVAGGPAGIKSNNIIIGTNITLPDGTSDSINLGAIIFASGSYATTTGNAFSGTVNGKVGINAVSFDATNPESLLVSGSNINTIVGTTNINNYAQLNIRNLNSGNAASADVVATNDSGTELGNFVDLGINSSTFAGTIGAANDAYLYHTGSNFLIGNTTKGATSLKLFSGNDATVFPIIITGSNAIITGSLLGSASFAQTASSADNFNVRTNLTASNALINGTITAQTLVVSVVSSSIDYSSGSNIFGSQLTNTHQFTGSVRITGSLSVVGSTNITNLTGSLLGSSSYATTASFAISASTFNITTALIIDQTKTDYASVASSTVGSNNLFTQVTGSYTSAFFKYTAYSASAATRAGEIVSAWNGTTETFTDFSTVDFGNTSGVTTAVTIVGANVQFDVTTATAGWVIKSLATFI